MIKPPGNWSRYSFFDMSLLYLVALFVTNFNYANSELKLGSISILEVGGNTLQLNCIENNVV